MAISTDESNPRICVVLGGRNFIGKSLVLQLLKSKNWIIRIADSDPSLNLDLKEQDSLLSHAISSSQASYFQVDVRDKSQIKRAIEGSEVLFHIDPTNSLSENTYHQYMITVQGTKNVISVCRESKVKRLIYNSSADVVFDGKHDICNGDESLPYPSKSANIFSDFKAQAESLILFANTSNGLLTCALRPSSPFGPGDTHLIPFIVNSAKSGLAKLILGNGTNMCDFTYVDNIAHAHVCAEEALRSGVTSVAGRAFFITNLEPMKYWDFASLILEGLGYQSFRAVIRLPARLVQVIPVIVNYFPQTMIHILSRTRTFNSSQAQNHIGYTPVVSLKEGATLTVQSFSQLAEGSPRGKSKAEKLLGSGRAGRVLLWRDERESFTYFLTLALLSNWFFLPERTFISSAAKILLAVTVVLYGLGRLPSPMFRLTVRMINPSHFQVPEATIKDLTISLTSAWNWWMRTLRSFARGDDWSTFFQVTVSLYLLKLLLSLSISTVFGLVLVFAFTAFFVYEQYEDEIDRVAEVSFMAIKSTMGLRFNKVSLQFGVDYQIKYIYIGMIILAKPSSYKLCQARMARSVFSL
ncbi:hypothetical protein MKW98_023821 [Papaver atlanticum]|uniref:Reticulon-like protein n=1 Tax=Papaver atlanticum TaxID=357466 RepID=A0AAD4XL32_9MAGN|nr:hypothetical protein MKW98_023821 [Papaver atlanticum]